MSTSELGADRPSDPEPSLSGGPHQVPLAFAERILGREISRQFARFILVGAVATVLFVVTYNLARVVTAAFTANAIAVVISSLGNYALNRRFTFGIQGRSRWMRQLGEFGLVIGSTMAISTGALAILFQLHPNASQAAENVAILGAMGALFVVRFWLLRSWVFHPAR